jgi:membrane protein CcdC involved in cytochrome C biogenesis
MSRIVIVILLYHRHKPVDLNEEIQPPLFATTTYSVFIVH